MAARVVVQVIESLTHNVVIHPRPGERPDDYAETITTLVNGYLCGGAVPVLGARSASRPA